MLISVVVEREYSVLRTPWNQLGQTRFADGFMVSVQGGGR